MFNEQNLEQARLYAYQDDPYHVVHRELRLQGQGLRFGDIIQLLRDYPEADDYGGIGVGTNDGRLITVSHDAVLSRTPGVDQFQYAKLQDYQHLLSEPVTIGSSWLSPIGRTALVGGIVIPDPNIKPDITDYSVHPSIYRSPSLIGRVNMMRFGELIDAGVSTTKLKRVILSQ